MPQNNKRLSNVPFSVLDLAPITVDGTPEHALQNSVDLARHVETWGYNRFWLAEHHNMPGIASSATSVLIGHVAGATERIRVGSGGIMLPNHATLVIAEQFGTLESLFPGRIDLGLGRAPGTDQATAFALRRTLNQGVEEFPRQLAELENYFSNNPVGSVRAIPGQGLTIPIWLLGSSDYSARLAAEKGLPFSFASHFAPDFMMQAIKIYRENFKPSDVLSQPYIMLGVNIIAADSEKKAHYLATSQHQHFINLRRNNPTKLKPPIENIQDVASPSEISALQQRLNSMTTLIGNKEIIKQGLEHLLVETNADELIINSQIFSHEERLNSFEIVAELMS